MMAFQHNKQLSTPRETVELAHTKLCPTHWSRHHCWVYVLAGAEKTKTREQMRKGQKGKGNKRKMLLRRARVNLRATQIIIQ